MRIRENSHPFMALLLFYIHLHPSQPSENYLDSQNLKTNHHEKNIRFFIPGYSFRYLL